MPESIKARRARRKRAAVLGVGLFAMFQRVCAVGLAALALLVEMPGWCAGLLWALAALCAALIIPALRVLKIRFQEIEGGELDAASQY